PPATFLPGNTVPRSTNPARDAAPFPRYGLHPSLCISMFPGRNCTTIQQLYSYFVCCVHACSNEGRPELVDHLIQELPPSGPRLLLHIAQRAAASLVSHQEHVQVADDVAVVVVVVVVSHAVAAGAGALATAGGGARTADGGCITAAAAAAAALA
ncbi:unnamed protein product, partial [Ectocarpus sp. 8 AP-2014]